MNHTHAHSTMNVKPADTTAKSRWIQMLNRICWMHTKIRHDQVIVVVFGKDIRAIITKSDLLRKDDDCVTVFHPDESITVINPIHVMKIYTARKGSVFL